MAILDQKILMCQSDLDLVKMFPISFDKKNEDGGGMYRLLYNYDMSLGVYSNIGGASETNFPFGALWDAYRD